MHTHINIASHKWSMTYRFLNFQESKISDIYMKSWKQYALPVITKLALWQLMHKGKWCMFHHAPRYIGCFKVFVMIARRTHGFHDYIHIHEFEKISIFNVLWKKIFRTKSHHFCKSRVLLKRLCVFVLNIYVASNSFP